MSRHEKLLAVPQTNHTRAWLNSLPMFDSELAVTTGMIMCLSAIKRENLAIYDEAVIEAKALMKMSK